MFSFPSAKEARGQRTSERKRKRTQIDTSVIDDRTTVKLGAASASTESYLLILQGRLGRTSPRMSCLLTFLLMGLPIMTLHLLKVYLITDRKFANIGPV